MSLVVVDASVLTAFYSATDPRRAAARNRLSGGDTLVAPAHVDAEVLSALRGLARSNPLFDAAVPAAIAHFRNFPLRRYPLAPLLTRQWQLRHNMTAYDAAYVALAEALDASLLTCDAKFAKSPGTVCAFELIS